jgi:hypothetical protein
MHIQEVLPRDAIPSIDDPQFGSEYFGDEDDDVIVVDGTPPRAYPVRILSYHEIVNDSLGGRDEGEGGRPIAVTWCPICASAVVFDRTVDSRVLTFGTSGNLADDALVMYDRETESEWKQPLGRAIRGPLEGTELTALPTSVLSWAAFQEAYPDGVVLQPVHGGEDDPRGPPRVVYDMTTYERYDAASAFGLREMRGEGPERTWNREDIGPKTTVLGVVLGEDAVGYPAPVLDAEGGLVTDNVSGTDLLVVGVDGRLDAFVDPGHEFELRDGTLLADGTRWEPTTGRAADGRQLERVPARLLYAFAWQDDHGRDSFYGLAPDGEP